MSDFKEILEHAIRALEKAEVVMPSDAYKVEQAKQALKKAIEERERRWYAFFTKWKK